MNKKKEILRAFESPSQMYIPVWFMRQAGRYLPEYRKTKEEAGGFISLCTKEEYAAEVSLQPLRRFDLDASILFSDIITPFLNLPIGLEFNPGPVLKVPIQDEKALEPFFDFDPEKYVSFVGKTLQVLKKKLEPEKGLIGFCGAPFTLMAYTTTGKFAGIAETKKFIYQNTSLALKILEVYAECMVSYLEYQIRNGAEIVQIFDTCAGELSVEEYCKFAKPFVQKIVNLLKKTVPSVPVLYFSNRVSHILKEVADISFDGLSIDSFISIASVSEILGRGRLIQGNLDPYLLFAGEKELEPVVQRICEQGKKHGKFIFNSGHGIHKDTDPEMLNKVIRIIRRSS